MSGTLAASFGWMFFLEGLLRVILARWHRRAHLALRAVSHHAAAVDAVETAGLLGTVEWAFLKRPGQTTTKSAANASAPVLPRQVAREATMMQSTAGQPQGTAPTLEIKKLTKYLRPARRQRLYHGRAARRVVRADRPQRRGKTTVFNMITGLYIPSAATFSSRVKTSSAWSRSRSRRRALAAHSEYPPVPQPDRAG